MRFSDHPALPEQLKQPKLGFMTDCHIPQGNLSKVADAAGTVYWEYVCRL